MKIYLYELSETPKDLHFTEKDAWVADTLVEAEENSQATPKKAPPAKVDFVLRKSQDLVFLKATVQTDLNLLCSRCANPYRHPLNSQIESMYTREKKFENANTNTGIAYSVPMGHSGEESDIEVLEKDYIELSDVLKEQIYLKIPFQPLCKEGCKGLCAVCGQDQNVKPCQCFRLKNTAMANALRNYLKKL